MSCGELHYEDVVAPTELGTLSWRVERDDADRYWASMPHGTGAPSVSHRECARPPLILFDQVPVNLIGARWAHGRTVRAGARWTVRRRVEVGEGLEVRARIARKFAKRGLGRLIVEASATVDGDEVGFVEMEEVTDPPAAGSGNGGPGLPPEGPGPSLTWSWRPTPEQLVAYSGRLVPAENIHTDRSLARAAGHRDLVVEGAHTLAVALEFLSDATDHDGGVDVTARFTRPWYLGDEARIAVSPLADPSGGGETNRFAVDVKAGELSVARATATLS